MGRQGGRCASGKRGAQRRGSDGSVLTEVHWLGKAKGQKGKAVKVWNCVVVEETSNGMLPTAAKQL